ncbi:MAG: ABC transporter permease subunit [Myxococcales bacterium]|nr:ABC transporter permease subunit [Myxococcales bacterium]
MKRLLPLLTLLTLLTVAGGAWAKLRWGADAEGGAPYVFHDPDDPKKVIGFEVDLARELGRVLGEPVEFVQYEYASLLVGLDRGDLDLAMNGLEVTPDRAGKARLSHPYYTYRLQLVARADDPACTSLAVCKGPIATLGDTAAERLLDARALSKKVYEGQVEPYRDLGLRRVGGVLLDLPIAEYYARRDPLLRFVDDPSLPKGHYAIAMRKADAALADRIDRAIDQLAREGALRKVLDRWGLWNADQETKLELGKETDTRWTFRRWFPLLLSGALTTVLLSVASMALAVLLALPLAAARTFGPRPLRALATTYVELFRGVPVLLVLFFLYYGLPTLGVRLSAWAAAVLGFGLNYAAYEAEIYRAALGAVPTGQWEAAASLGMSRALTFRRIVLPQAVRVALPPMTSDFVALFKDTSLVSVIAVVELTKQYQILAKSSLRYLEIGLATAALYLTISLPLGLLSRRLEARWSRGHA